MVKPPSFGEPLSSRELQVAAAIAEGLSNKRIADRLGVSFYNAKFHVRNVMLKLGADNRTHTVTLLAKLAQPAVTA